MATSNPRTIHVIGRTEYLPVPGLGLVSTAGGGQAVAEFAGRACYQTFDRPNPATADNADYLRHMLEVGHLAVFEHGVATLYITGISRSMAHEFIRHRHFSCTELNQRHTGPITAPVMPDVIAESPELAARFQAATDAAEAAYAELLAGIELSHAGDPQASVKRKQARQAARAVLPNATGSALVVTGNYRAWRHFIGMRATEAADLELRSLAVEVLAILQQDAPAVFADFRLSTLADGSRIAASPFVGDG